MNARLALLLTLLSACAYTRKETHIIPLPTTAVTAQSRMPGLTGVRLLSAQLPQRMPSGLPWDDDDTPPDAFVRVLIDDRQIWQSPVAKDTFAPVWNLDLPQNIDLSRKQRLRFEVWDKDSLTRSDPLGSGQTSGVGAGSEPTQRLNLRLGNLGLLRIELRAPTAHAGVGLAVEIRGDDLRVVRVLPHSPASRARIKPRDRIIAIGGKQVSAMSGNEAFSELSLAADRKLSLTVVSGQNSAREVELDNLPLWLVM